MTFEQTITSVLKAHCSPSYFVESMLGEKLFPKQREIMNAFYSGDYNQLVVVAGMRSGKTRLGVFMLLYELFKLLCVEDLIEHYRLAKGEKIFLLAVSYKEDQAHDTILLPMLAEIEGSDFFSTYRWKTVGDEIRFDDVTIRTFGANSLGNVGRTAKAIMFDEIARYKTTTGKTSGKIVYQTLSRSTETFGRQGYKFVFSAPLSQDDFSMQLLRESQHNSSILGYQLTTWDFNPNITHDSLKSEFERDYLGAQRDYGAIPPSGTEPFFADTSILRVSNRPNLLVAIFDDVPVTVEPHDYVLACDPAVRNNAFGFCLAHKEHDKIVIDGLLKYLPTKMLEIDPLEIEQFIYKIVERIPVSTAVFDVWNYPTVLARLAQRGINVVNHIVRKADYDALKAKLYEDKIDICNYPELLDEMRTLETKQNKIIAQSKDVSDALCNAIWQLEQEAETPVAFNIGRRI